MIIKTKKRNDGKTSRDKKRYRTEDKKIKRQVLRNKYSVG